MLVRACRRAPETLLKLMAPDVVTEYWETMLPTSKVFAPATVTAREMGAPGWTAAKRSAQRPPQPVNGGRSGIEVCHCVTWSECENSCGGLANTPERYSARVIG